MSTTKLGLGRGLGDLGVDELLSDVSTKTSEQNITNDAQLKKLPIDIIQPGKYQPRKDMDYDALEELAASIRSQGIIQPIVVRPLSFDKYEIIAGERRWRAAQMAELHEVPAVIRMIADDSAIAMSLIENIQRENLNAIEEANALQRLLEEFSMTHQEVADAVGKSRTTITNLLRLLTLQDKVKTMLEHGDLEMGHARALLALEGLQQLQTAQTVVAKGLSVRETEGLVKRVQAPHKKSKEKTIDSNISSLQNNLADKIGASVKIEHATSGRGKLIIQYNSLDELDGILEHIK